MYIPSFQSLVCLSLLTAPYVSAIPLDEDLQPRAVTTCNANNVKTLKNSQKQPVQYCKSWLASKHTKSAVKGLTVAQVSNVCKCIEASASSSSAAAKKTTSAKKKTTSVKRATLSTKKTTSSKKTTKKATSTKATTKKASSTIKSIASKKASSTSSKKASSTSKVSTHAQSTSKKTTTSKRPTTKSSTSKLISPSSSSAVHFVSSSTIPSSSVHSDLSSSDHSTSSALSKTSSTFTLVSSVSSSSTTATLSSASSSTLSSPTTVSSNVTPSNSSVFANGKNANSVTTRSASSTSISSGKTTSGQVSSTAAAARIADATPSGQNILVNGDFSGGSFTNWHAASAIDTKFGVSSLASDSNYQALIKYTLDSEENGSGQIYQNVTIPAGMSYQLYADVYLNYPNDLPDGVTCVIKYSLGGDTMILNQYGVASSSGANFTDSVSGQIGTAFSGRFQIYTYCNSVASSTTSFVIGFGNVQLFISATPTSTSTSSTAAATTSSSATSSTCAPSVATNTNLVTNGDFGTGSLSSWTTTAATVGNASFSVETRSGSSNYYAVMDLTPTNYNEANGQINQVLQVVGGYSFNFSADVYFNLPGGLPTGAVCTITYEVGSTPIYGYEITSTIASSSSNHISDSQTGTISSSDCNAALQIYADCSNITSPVSIGFDNIQLTLQAGSATSTSNPSATTAPASATATASNIISNGDFGTGDYTDWALYRLGDTSFAIQGNPNAYVSVMTFPSGGDANSQAGLMQQEVTVLSGKTYTLSMGLLLDYPSALPNDGSTCSLEAYLVDSNGYGVMFAQTSYGYGDAAFQTVTGSGKIHSGFDGYFDILLRCYGGASQIITGIEDVEVWES